MNPSKAVRDYMRKIGRKGNEAQRGTEERRQRNRANVIKRWEKRRAQKSAPDL
jgi:hypothetical protein